MEKWSPRIRLASDLAGFFELLDKLFTQPVEAAVGHDQQQIPGFGFGGEMLRNSIRGRKDVRVLSELAYIRGDHFGIHAVFVAQLLPAVDSAENHVIAQGERFWQR